MRCTGGVSQPLPGSGRTKPSEFFRPFLFLFLGWDVTYIHSKCMVCLFLFLRCGVTYKHSEWFGLFFNEDAE